MRAGYQAEAVLGSGDEAAKEHGPRSCPHVRTELLAAQVGGKARGVADGVTREFCFNHIWGLDALISQWPENQPPLASVKARVQ